MVKRDYMFILYHQSKFLSSLNKKIKTTSYKSKTKKCYFDSILYLIEIAHFTESTNSSVRV